MPHIEKAVEIERPVEVVYDHLTGLPNVEVTEQVRDEAVSWRRREDDGDDAWRASLIALSPKRTRLDLAVDHDPTSLLDRAADALGSLERRVTDEVTRLKSDIEAATDPD